MGAAVSSAKRAIRNWNAANRAIKHLDREAKFREKASFRPKVLRNLYDSNSLLHEKNASLEERVSSFNIISEGVKRSILPEGFNYVPNSTRKLPQRFEIGSPIPPPHIEFGFAIPEVIPRGKITMAQAINLVKSHQLNIKTVPQLADEYGLDPTLVASICKNFSLFECESVRVWIPPTKLEDKKILLDRPISQEDERITDDGASRYIRLNELEPPVST